MIDGTSLLLSGAGVKTLTYHWIENLYRTAGRHRVSVFPYIRTWQELDHERSHLGWISTEGRLAFVRLSNRIRLNIFNIPARGQDLFHSSQHLRTPPTRARLTATVYDATCWLFPQTHTPENVAATKLYAERVLKKADGIIAVSEATRADAIRVLGLPEDKIRCIYPSVPDTYFNVDPANITSKRYGLETPYFLYAGAVEPRKNLGGLLDAFAGLPKSVREQYELVIAGPAMWDSQQMVQRLKNQTGVRYLGYVPEADLPALTAGAYAFVFPSLYEGFGLPLAQAVAAGVPAITSGTSSLPEVAGEGALFVDPRSVEDMRTAMQRLALSPDLRARLAIHARTHAERFRWQRNAEQSWLFFEQILAAG
jgi:glycosyltransferase involved in cell wall biosynthesis